MNLRYIKSRAWLFAGRSIWRNYPYLIADMIGPMSLLFVVAVISQGRGLPFALVGGLISMVTMSGITQAPLLGWFRFNLKYKDLTVTTRTGPIDYMFGEIFASLVWTIPGIIIYLGLDLYFNLLTLYALAITIVVVSMVIIAASSIAFWLSNIVKSSRFLWAYVGILSMFMTILPPTFYPYTLLPKPALYALAIFPTTPAAVIEQAAFGLKPIDWYMVAILIIETFVYFLVARHLTKWREV